MNLSRKPIFVRGTSLALHINFSLLMTLSLSGCISLSKSDPTVGAPHETLKALAERNHVCAVAVAVIKHRKLDSINTESGCLPATTLGPDSVFQAASLSKPVFAYAVLKLVEQGKLDLDAPVMKYLPQVGISDHRDRPFRRIVTDDSGVS